LIKLKDLLTEDWIDNDWYPAHTRGAMDWIRSGDKIPLTPKTIEKAVGKKIPVKSFHITVLMSYQKSRVYLIRKNLSLHLQVLTKRKNYQKVVEFKQVLVVLYFM
jgi:hypothetical protein